MSLSPETERALESCYDAITRPSGWTAALDDLAHAMGAHACLILQHEFSGGDVFVRSSGTRILDELWQRNLDWVKPVIEPRGDFYVRHGFQSVTQAHMFTDEEIRHSRFHQEIARPAGLLHLAGGIFSVGGRDWAVPFFRSTEPFAPDLLEPLAEVARRLARIVSISEKVSQHTAENEIRTLERIGCAAILVGRHGQVMRANEQAEGLFCGAFGIRHGKLWTASSGSLSRIDKFMMKIEFAREVGKPLPAPIVVARDGKPWLLIEAMPVSAASTAIFDGYRAILVISDLTSKTVTDAALLAQVFDLTSAEARLAVAICDGCDLATAARNFGISRQTIRSQLKAVFAKTGARRQAELVARLAHIKYAVHH